MELQMVVFNLADETFGVPIEQVREIIRFTSVTAMPKAPASVLGVINLRGRVIPVFNLRERFGFGRAEVDSATRIIVSEVGDQTTGFVVDSVTEVLRLDDSSIEPPPASAAGVQGSFIRGIGKVGDRLVILLDLDKVFDRENLSLDALETA